jgi:hypothetical protein
MKRVSIWTLVVVFGVLLYLAATLLVRSFAVMVPEIHPTSTPTPELTFTPTATLPVIVRVTSSRTASPISTATPTLPPIEEATATLTLTLTPTPIVPLVTASVKVNVRSGPGANYPIVGGLLPGKPLQVIGQNEAGTWWQVRQSDGHPGWVAAAVVEASHVEAVPIAQAPPPPAPTPTPIPPTPARPKYQFEPTGWFDDTNRGLTRFFGSITDINGNPANGVTIEAQCGTYRIISNPSGPVPAFNSNDSANDPPGFYDITVATKPVPCKWLLTVVYTEDGKTALARLSETIEVEVTVDKSIVVANWRKNW